MQHYIGERAWSLGEEESGLGFEATEGGPAKRRRLEEVPWMNSSVDPQTGRVLVVFLSDLCLNSCFPLSICI